MKEFINIVNSSFMRNIFGGASGWWEYRIKVWENYHLESLKNQTEKDFYYVLNISNKTPQKFIPLMDEVLKRSGLNYLIVNRRKEGELKRKIENNFPRVRYIYFTRIDTDDVYHKKAIEEVQSYKFKWRRILFFQKGYQYDCANKEMRHYKMKSPPFYTIMFPWNILFDVEKRGVYKASHGSHDLLYDSMDPVVMSENKIMVLVHQRNKRARPEHIFFNPDWYIPKGEHKKILEEFGIEENKYEKIFNGKN